MPLAGVALTVPCEDIIDSNASFLIAPPAKSSVQCELFKVVKLKVTRVGGGFGELNTGSAISVELSSGRPGKSEAT